MTSSMTVPKSTAAKAPPTRPRRRFTQRGTRPTVRLADDHPAVVGATPLFPTRVRSASAAEWILKRGVHSKKLASHFSKGDWLGLPIYSLSLPERSTCPRSCKVWNDCYGNGMPYAVRFRVDQALYVKLTVELEALAVIYPKGFAVRLHSLGDFANPKYVRFWLDAIRAIPKLCVFGFTAWPRASEIGSLIEAESSMWDRFRIRFSGDNGRRGATVDDPDVWGKIEGGIVCPAQGHRSEISCGSCGFCVTSQEPVVFARH